MLLLHGSIVIIGQDITSTNNVSSISFSQQGFLRISIKQNLKVKYYSNYLTRRSIKIYLEELVLIRRFIHMESGLHCIFAHLIKAGFWMIIGKYFRNNCHDLVSLLGISPTVR